jgi:hypothetical protein
MTGPEHVTGDQDDQEAVQGGVGDGARKAVLELVALFFGLVPITIGAMRIYLMSQGDSGTMLLLVRTLDVQALFLGTFIRFIGVFGTASAAYLFCRVFWPRLAAAFHPAVDSPGSASGAASSRRVGPGRWRWGAFSILVVVFAISVGALYPEQILDGSNTSWGPVDIVRSLVWSLVIYVTLRYAAFNFLYLVSDRIFRRGRASGSPEASWRRRQLLFKVPGDAVDGLSHFKPEVFILIPAVLLLFWSYLVTNDRMWLPAEVVTVRSAPAGLSPARDANLRGGDTPVVHSDGSTSFIGFVLESDELETTILRPGGGAVVVPRASVVDQQPCQFEPDFDPGVDRPLIAHLPGFQMTTDARIVPPCLTVLASSSGG